MRLFRIALIAMAALVAGEAATQDAAPKRERVTLYEEDPSNPEGARFAGTAAWRTEPVTPGATEIAIVAEIEAPERGLAMTLSIRRNTDKSLPASHVIEIIFKASAKLPSGSMSNLPGLLMKQNERQRGAPLASLAVRVSEDAFLVGLLEVEAEKQRNLQMLWQRDWFDIPFVYKTGRRAILAVEKSQKAFDEAYGAWSDVNR